MSEWEGLAAIEGSYLVNRATGVIAKTVQPTAIVNDEGKVITAYPGRSLWWKGLSPAWTNSPIR
ncbi:hypothetical protein [Nocardia pneumoniae]|uniref:hypothetical protein n=1 Tax=Nocardia pneumoniae TaxID=228601 RepID=UPI000592A6ED|nr:hypothetical protein [Nocardia pneumoniae]